jgi:ABC-2 type transport system permease protein
MIRLLRAELQKLLTVWSTYLIAGIVVVLDVALGLIIGLVVPRVRGGGGGTAGRLPHGSYLWFFRAFTPLGFTIELTLVLGVIIVTTEYRHKTITPSYLAEPRRGRNVAAKLITSFFAGAALGLLTTMVGLGVGWSLVLTKVHSCLVRSSTTVRGHVFQGMSQVSCTALHGVYYVANSSNLWTAWWHVAPGVVAAGALFCVYGAGLGALLKNQIVGIVVGLLFTLVVEGIIGGIWPTIGEYFPGGAAAAVENLNIGERSAAILPWWGGVSMLLVYGVVLAVVSAMTTVRADIT